MEKHDVKPLRKRIEWDDIYATSRNSRCEKNEATKIMCHQLLAALQSFLEMKWFKKALYGACAENALVYYWANGTPHHLTLTGPCRRHPKNLIFFQQFCFCKFGRYFRVLHERWASNDFGQVVMPMVTPPRGCRAIPRRPIASPEA